MYSCHVYTDKVHIYWALLLLFFDMVEDKPEGWVALLLLPTEAALAGLFLAFFFTDLLFPLLLALALEALFLLVFLEGRFLCFLAGFVLTWFPMANFDTMRC